MTEPRTLARRVRSLDDALYSASCYAANSPTRAVGIWMRVTPDNHEEYAIIDTDVIDADEYRRSHGWTLAYTLSAPVR